MRFGFIIMLMVGIQSCRQVTQPTDISGLWYSCDENGMYSELLADDNYFLTFDGKEPDGQIWKYKIENDTLYFELPEIEGAMTQWTIIDKFEKDHLITYSKFSKDVRKDDLIRLDATISIVIDPNVLTEKSEELELLRAQYNERKKRNVCQRSE